MVWVRRSAWERVTERDELAGRLRVGSRFPQYLICQGQFRVGGREQGIGRERSPHLMTAMLTGAVVLAR